MEITTDNLATTFRTSGLTQEVFCKEHSITLEKLRYYLYKKTNTKNVRKKRTRRSSTVPAFISFNKTDGISTKVIQDTSSSLTIIHGNFTPKQLAAFISELDQIC
jgi:hypothetical protein